MSRSISVNTSSSSGLPGESRSYPPGVAEPSGGPHPQQKGCGCCGCSGCSLGCLMILIIVPAVVAMLLLFSPNMGDAIDRFAITFYRQQGRSLILTSPGIKGSPQEKQQMVLMVDDLVTAYEDLPSEERRTVRQELLWSLYYDAQNKKPPPDKVRNLNRFIESQTRILQQRHP